jgi:hypothetical protein
LKCFETKIFIFSGILKDLVDKSLVGASVREMCEWGDKQILQETSKVFKKEKDLKKGLFLNDQIIVQLAKFINFQVLRFPRAYL